MEKNPAKFTLNNIIYEVNTDGEAVVIGNTINEVCDVDIPYKVICGGNSFLVTVINKAAFKGNQYIDYLTLPSTIKEVQEEAFMQSSIRFLNFSQMVALHDVKIFPRICYECVMLEEAHLPSGIHEIPDYAFYKAIRLHTINTPRGLVRIGNFCFCQCESLMHFDFVSNDITEIGIKSFLDSKITYAEIGYRVSTVGDQAFKSKNLSTLVVFNQIATIGNEIITDDRKITVYIKGNKTSKNALYFSNNTSNIHYLVIDDFTLLEKRGVKYLSFELDVARVVGFIDSELEENTIIKDSIAGSPVTDFQPRAFAYSRKLVTCIFPKSILRIKGKVFEGCINLKRVTFQHSITQEEAKWAVYNDNVDISIVK